MVNLVLVIIQDYLKYSLPYAVILMIAYEFSIVTMGLKNYVFYGPRTDFISANREGIVSSCGYLAVSLIGIETGRTIFQALYSDKKSYEKD